MIDMSAAIELLGEDKVRADMFFDREPVRTDWDRVREQIKSGEITSAGVLAQIKAYEPLKEDDYRDQAHWVDQQRFRLALLHEDEQPMEGTNTCESCGSRKVDPLYAKREWSQQCLHCIELKKQVDDFGGRGNCEFLSVRYNPRSHSWGLLYYHKNYSGRRDSVFMFWLVEFYKTREEAERALWPIRFYFTWLNIKHNGMIRHWLDFSKVLPLEDVIKLPFPLSPEKFREHLRSAIQADMDSEQRLMRYYVHEAMDKHERKERDE